MRSSVPSVFLYFALCTLAIRGWGFTAQLSNACLGVDVSWSGGTPPYTFTLISTPNVTTSNFNNISSWASGVGITYVLDQAYPASTGGANLCITTGDTNPLVVVGSDAAGFGSGGTSEVFSEVSDLPQRTPPSTRNSTRNDTGYLSFLQQFSTNVTACGTVTAQINASFTNAPSNVNGSLAHMVYIDTIVPLGQSYRTSFNTSATNVTTISWPITVSAGTTVAFALGVPTTDQNLWDEVQFVTPLVTVQPGNTSCQASGTLSSPPSAMPTSPQSTSAATRRVLGSSLPVVMTVVSVTVMTGIFKVIA